MVKYSNRTFFIQNGFLNKICNMHFARSSLSECHNYCLCRVGHQHSCNSRADGSLISLT